MGEGGEVLQEAVVPAEQMVAAIPVMSLPQHFGSLGIGRGHLGRRLPLEVQSPERLAGRFGGNASFDRIGTARQDVLDSNDVEDIVVPVPGGDAVDGDAPRRSVARGDERRFHSAKRMAENEDLPRCEAVVLLQGEIARLESAELRFKADLGAFSDPLLSPIPGFSMRYTAIPRAARPDTI